MQGNVLGQSGGSTGLNIFAQPNEPSKKDGIWIKTDEKYKFENIQFVNTLKSLENNYIDIPSVPIIARNITNIGTNIYLGSNEGLYKYNILTGLYTKISSTELNRSCTAVGTDIYTYTNSSGKCQIVKYDTVSNQKTNIKEISSFSGVGLIAIDSIIYIFGVYNSKTIMYKYDIQTDTVTKLSSISYTFSIYTVTSVGTDIYLFFEENTAFKYNTLTDEFTQLADCPFSFIYAYNSNDICASVGTDIYIFVKDKAFKYNTLTDEYTQLTNCPFNESVDKACISIDSNIYLFTYNEEDENYYAYQYIASFNVENKTILITTEYYVLKVLLNKHIEIYFSGAKIYDNDTLQDYPTYFGDGEQWNLLN